MLSNRRDFLQSALPAALVGIPLIQEKEVRHKFKIGQKFYPRNLPNSYWIGKGYFIVGLLTEETKEGIKLGYKLRPLESEYDFTMAEENLSDERFLIAVK